MRLLLDTHVVLWALSAPRSLSPAARASIADEANDAWVSVASLWEVAIKQRLGKLTLPAEAGAWLPSALEVTGIAPLAIQPRHAYAAGALPDHHRDPFDRMIIAQAREEGMAIVTRDERFRRYGVTVVAA